jgi:His/Glu/Gln/Arg/opine family amino acid ABC transporter permease subunit
MFERQSLVEILLFLLPGLAVTFKLALMTAFTGVGAGAVLGCVAAWGGPVVRAPLFGLLVVARGVPLLVQVFALFFGLPALGIRWSATASAAVALIFFTAMTTMEIVRGGILGVPKEQILAARALGLSFLQTLGTVVLPQAGRIVLPSFVNQLVLVIKATSIVSFIGVADVMMLAKESVERTQMGFETMGMVWIIYTCACLPLTTLGRRLERVLTERGFALTEAR